jgi:hypothetical protein
MRTSAAIVCICALSTLLLSCAEDTSVAGSSTSTGNAQATGVILKHGGHPAVHSFVECRPNSLASWEPLKSSWTARTDTNGRYRCSDLPDGEIGIHALDPKSGQSHWHLIQARSGTIDSSGSDTLAAPGRLLVALAPATYGTLHLSGLGRYLPVNGESVVTFTDLPAHWRGAVRLASHSNLFTFVDSGHVRSGRTDSAGFTRSATTLSIPLAGGLKTALKQVPILIRLDSTWKGFANSLPDASDLRLSSTDGKPLPLTVASWEPHSRTGTLWTMLDSLAAPGDSIRLVLSSGIPVPANSQTTGFTATNGWIATWPLGDAGDTAIDRTGNFPSPYTKTTVTTGVIANATRFDGRSSRIVVPNSTSGSLQIPEGGPLTYSCWVRITSSAARGHVMGRGNYGPGIAYRTESGNRYWIGSEYRNAPSGTNFVTAPADSGTWTHLALTVSGSAISLFVNGARQATDSGLDQRSVERKPLPFLIGASIDTLGLTSTHSHFGGDMAEAWVQSVARPSDWIRLTAANQRPGGPVAKVR